MVCNISVFTLVAVMASASVQQDRDGQTITSKQRQVIKSKLEPFNDLVGSWRGVGQPRRGSRRGAWQESNQCAWSITKSEVAVKLSITDGKLYRGMSISFQPEADKFQLTTVDPEKKRTRYNGALEKKSRYVFLSEKTKGDVRRITLSLLHADRMTLLIEDQLGKSRFVRVAEVGYTREGGSFAKAGDGGRKCIVTGGRGTIAVTYQGKTYYVCCGGCKDAFEDDPAGIIAEASGRKP